jgi:threonine dehydratase
VASDTPSHSSNSATNSGAGPKTTPPTSSRAARVSLEDIRRAAKPGAGVVRETPVVSSRTLSERVGGAVVLKAENLQRTGSFKIRGALAKLAALGDSCSAGVVTGSAGNHAQAVASAARARGVACYVFMPETAPIAKIEAARALGADITILGATVDETFEAARERATGDPRMAFVHPFEDPDVIAGQGTLGLELLAQVPDIARVVVPVGGGGLISGVAIAAKSQRPGIEVFGVQAASCSPVLGSLAAGKPVAVRSALTIADGIAVKCPGEMTLSLMEQWVDGMVEVDEDEVAEAMVFLLERAKLVVEGAGAVGVAALLSGRVRPSASGTTVALLSGGNVDAGLLAEVARRHESQAGRRLVLLASLPDRPGSLAQLLTLVGELRANLLDVEHIREAFDLHVRETAVQLVLETRGPAHAQKVTEAVRAAGYSEPRALR